MQTTSSKYSIDWRDAAHGLLVASGGAAITVIQNSFEAQSFNLNWHNIASVAMAAGLSYLAKRFFTPAQTVITQQ